MKKIEFSLIVYIAIGCLMVAIARLTVIPASRDVVSMIVFIVTMFVLWVFDTRLRKRFKL